MEVGIDPGPEQSGLVVRYSDGKLAGEIMPNKELLGRLGWLATLDWRKGRLYLEMMAGYGKPVGCEVFQTVLWTGRFAQAWQDGSGTWALVYRRDVKLYLCGDARAGDPHVRQALIDLYGPGREKAIGIKARPGPLHGFKGDMWAALAVLRFGLDTGLACRNL